MDIRNPGTFGEDIEVGYVDPARGKVEDDIARWTIPPWRN